MQDRGQDRMGIATGSMIKVKGFLVYTIHLIMTDYSPTQPLFCGSDFTYFIASRRFLSECLQTCARQELPRFTFRTA
jgi:hypothetical protein